MECFKLPLCLLCLLSFLLDLSEGNCGKNNNAERHQFGQDCNYLCRCEDQAKQCNITTGECPDGKCQHGWMGPACQYVNFAYRKTTGSSNSNKAIDGNEATCVQGVSSLDLDLTQVYPIKTVTVVIDGTGSNLIVICLKHEPSGVEETCVNTTEITTVTDVHFVFENIVHARHVHVKLGGQSANVCEIKISGGRNLAYKQSASQISTDFNGGARKAVDGTSGGGVYDTRACTHTKLEENPWWKIDLGSVYKVVWFRVYNRLDQCCIDRLLDFTVSLSNLSDVNSGAELYRDSRTTLHGTADPIEIGNVQISEGQYVQVELPGNEKVLTLCEIEVIGDCPENTCGFACNDICYCKVASYVDKLKGLCFDGCQIGWTGDGHRCDKECMEGKYGSDCNLSCGMCKNGTACHHITGYCPGDGCEAGWIGWLCNDACAHGKYGDNCSLECGNCIVRPCNHVDGRCTDSRCEAGYKGSYCKEHCKSGTYGINCTSTCGQCKDKNPCDPMTGECTNGCESGWEPSNRCDVKSEAQTGLEKNSESVAGIAGGISAVVLVVICCILIFIILRRRRARQREAKEQTTQRSFKNLEGSTYENAAFIESLGVKPSSIRNDATDGKLSSVRDALESKFHQEEDETYYNVRSENEQLPEGVVRLADLWEYVQRKLSSLSSMEEEFKALPSGLKHPTTDAKKQQNIQKNRYRNLYAYDHSRVHLIPYTEDDGDYVNACFVDGFNQPKAFIASQGATLKNMNDIWRMIWQQNCGKVVMLTNLVENGTTKCEKYWPDEGEQQYGSISVTIQDSEKLADCTVRIFRVSHKKEGQSKIMKHLHYTAWPDKDVPGVASSLVQFWNKVKQTTCPMNGPILVHCSAGIGRTGTFIALDYLVEQGRKEGGVNFAECVRKIREQRVNLVQTKEQYLFLHEAVVEALMLSGTGVSSDKFPGIYMELQQIDVDKRQTKLLLEYEKLQQDNPFDRERANLTDDEEGDNNVKDEFATAKLPENFHRNRYSNILAADKYRPHLTSPPKGGSHYINAVYMPSHRNRSAFILTQMPLPSTVEDFWTLVQQEEIYTVVMMNIHNPRTSQLESAMYLPEQNDVTFGDFTIETIDNNRGTGFKTRDMRWTRNSTSSSSTLRQFQFLAWPDKSKVPTDHTSLLHLFEAILQWQRQSPGGGPILVHCMDGAERSGLFCVLSTIIERLNIERDVAVAQTIKKMRIIRQQIIPNYEQFQFCHDVVLEYLKTFDTYSNFA